MPTKFWGLIIIVCSLTSALAQDLTPQQETAANRIFNEVLSPFCPGRSLNDCPSSKASELKQEVRLMLTQGKSGEEVVSSLFSRFGESIRAVPQAKGFDALAWIMPFGFIIIGGIVLFTWLSSRHKPRSANTEQSLSDIDPKVEARIEKELAQMSDN